MSQESAHEIPPEIHNGHVQDEQSSKEVDTKPDAVKGATKTDSQPNKSDRKIAMTGMDFITNTLLKLSQTPLVPELWSSLLKEALIVNNPPVVRDCFEKFFVHFPTKVTML